MVHSNAFTAESAQTPLPLLVLSACAHTNTSLLLPPSLSFSPCLVHALSERLWWCLFLTTAVLLLCMQSTGKLTEAEDGTQPSSRRPQRRVRKAPAVFSRRYTPDGYASDQCAHATRLVFSMLLRTLRAWEQDANATVHLLGEAQ